MSIDQEELPPYTVADVSRRETAEQHDLEHPLQPTSSQFDEAKAYIVTLSYQIPGIRNEDGIFLYWHNPIRALQDAVLIPDKIIRSELETLLLGRVLQRFGAKIGQPKACTLFLYVGGKPVQLVCDDSWKAGQRILEAQPDARLDFSFVTCLQEEVAVAAPSKKLGEKKGSESQPADTAIPDSSANGAQASKKKELSADKTCAVQ